MEKCQPQSAVEMWEQPEDGKFRGLWKSAGIAVAQAAASLLIAFQFQATASAIIRAISADLLFVGF